MKRKGERGLTLIELIVAFTILSLLTTMAVPLARYRVRLEKERELRYSLREIDKAIDDYKDASLTGKIEVKLGTDGYPEKAGATGGRREAASGRQREED
jgi:general secretion pathway protein G